MIPAGSLRQGRLLQKVNFPSVVSPLTPKKNDSRPRTVISSCRSNTQSRAVVPTGNQDVHQLFSHSLKANSKCAASFAIIMQ